MGERARGEDEEVALLFAGEICESKRALDLQHMARLPRRAQREAWRGHGSASFEVVIST